MKKRLTFFAVAVALSMVSAPSLAHHGRGQTYDMENEITLQGRVTQVLWRNPHVLWFMDVEDENGNVVNWAFEHGSTSSLSREGYHRNTLKVGDAIVATVHAARNGGATSIVVKVILPDGTEMMCRGSGCD